MTEEAEKIAALIASLRKSARDIDRECERADPALRNALEARRNNLMVTITALEDRVSAIQGLIKLDRPYVGHRTFRRYKHEGGATACSLDAPRPAITAHTEDIDRLRPRQAGA
jgi:hypothetical protein